MNSLTICVTTSFVRIIAQHGHFYCFLVTKFYECFLHSVSCCIILWLAVAYVNHPKAVIAIVGCCHLQN